MSRIAIRYQGAGSQSDIAENIVLLEQQKPYFYSNLIPFFYLPCHL